MADHTAADLFGTAPTRPPLDPELAPVEEALRTVVPPLSDEPLAETRRQPAGGLPGLEPEDLTMGGRVRSEERRVPWPDGAPDITLLILSPAGTGPRAGEASSTSAGAEWSPEAAGRV
ncbi:hypothetical protein AB0G86_23325 [Streptomyces scabiei]|uniref:hypothetical protein n=1 Tax=Streptomyces scabiei TaxID=1930 RepID=UPI0033EF4D33